MKTPHTIKLFRRNGKPRYDPIADVYSDEFDDGVEVRCLANYIEQSKVFEMYGDRTKRVLVARFEQEQAPFDKAKFNGREFKPIEMIDAPIKGSVRLQEV